MSSECIERESPLLVVEERWAAIEGYPRYEISDHGRVRRQHSEDYLQRTISRDGYLRIRLCCDGRGRTFLVHRLVAIAYIPNPNNLPFVDHISRDRGDCCWTNLRWATASDNLRNARKLNQNAASKFKGVRWEKRQQKWIASIKIDGKNKWLGTFADEASAADAYDDALLSISPTFGATNQQLAEQSMSKAEKVAVQVVKTGTKQRLWLSKPPSSKYAGVSFHKRSKRWRAFFNRDGKHCDVGGFATEERAAEARERALMAREDTWVAPQAEEKMAE